MNNIKEDILNDSSLFEYYVNFSNYSITDNFITFESRFSTLYKKPIVYMDDQILDAQSKLNDEYIEILKERLIFSKTLTEIGQEKNITRERVRQIEENNIKKFFALVDRSVVIKITNLVDNQSIVFLDDIPIKDHELKLLFCSILSHKKIKKVLYDKNLKALVKNSAFSFSGVLNKIEHYVDKSKEEIFTRNDLVTIFQLFFPKMGKINKLITVLEAENKIRKIDDDQYFFPFLYKPKKPMLEFIFSLYPNGLELHKEIDFITDELNKFFPGVFKEKDKKRAIPALVGFSDNVLLWDWGRYLHIKYIYSILEEYDFSSVLNYLDKHLENTQIDLQSCFEYFEKELISVGIISKYALHTCLKLKYPDDYSYQDSPWISKAGTKRRELRQTLRNLMTENRNYSLNELVESMHTNKTRVQQLIDNTDDIIQVNPFQYKKKEFLAFPKVLLEQIIQYANAKVKELEFIYIDLIIDQFSEKLNEYKQYDLRLMLLELLKKEHSDNNFKISNTRIIEKNYPLTRDRLNFHILIENLLNDKNTISINEIASYFIKRGLSHDRIMMYYRYSKITRIIRLDKETFTSIDKIGLTQKQINKINLMLENTLISETHIDDILMYNKLPKISVGWNRFVLTDITDYTKFVFSPSRENPIYISKKG